jgi:hypothetical protein
VQAAGESDLVSALEVVKARRLGFWDATLWASVDRAGVRHLLSEDFQDGFALQGVNFINQRENDQLIDEMIVRWRQIRRPGRLDASYESVVMVAMERVQLSEQQWSAIAKASGLSESARGIVLPCASASVG